MKKAGGIVAIAGGAVGLGVALGILMFENAYKNEEFTDSGNIATATPEVSTKGASIRRNRNYHNFRR